MVRWSHAFLYLASTSPARLALLRAAGIEPVLISPGVDEDAAVAAERRGSAAPSPVRDRRAPRPRQGRGGRRRRRRRAADRRVRARRRLRLRDRRRVHGKPHEPAVALDRWRQSGRRRRHALGGHWSSTGAATWTGLGHGRSGGRLRAHRASVRDVPVAWRGTVPSGRRPWRVRPRRGGRPRRRGRQRGPHLRRRPVRGEIDAYVATGEPLEVAGAFTIDGRASAFITHIEGTPSAVVGLSIPVLRSLLRGFGVAVARRCGHCRHPPASPVVFCGCQPIARGAGRVG